jgi:hypothetical protein
MTITLKGVASRAEVLSKLGQAYAKRESFFCHSRESGNPEKI